LTGSARKPTVLYDSQVKQRGRHNRCLAFKPAPSAGGAKVVRRVVDDVERFTISDDALGFDTGHDVRESGISNASRTSFAACEERGQGVVIARWKGLQLNRLVDCRQRADGHERRRQPNSSVWRV